MAKSNTRLELTWIGKENRPKLEPRILIEDPEKSYHATFRRGREENSSHEGTKEGEKRPVRRFGKAKDEGPTLFDYGGLK
ncbi:MAG: hypothetical protein K9N49_00555 [Candidatus Marinimicrobia bacterium]|nr:hypothetical protein [Candidatus Neomarinimicrobiota bacterium]